MAPTPPLLLLQDIHLGFGGTPLLTGAELSVSAGERLALVGRNGSGKSTLLRLAAGLLEPDRGSRFLQPGTTIRYLPQEPDLSAYATVLAYVEAGLGPGDDPYRAHYLLAQLGLSGEENPLRLSGGEARRAAIACALAPSPDIILVDEPTNHLDLPTIEWLEAELSSMRSAMVLISHDRRVLETLSRATVWLDRGLTRRMDRGFAQFEDWRDAVLEQEERDRHKLDRKIVDEEHWLRYGVSARRTRNQRRLAQLHALRQERRDQRKATGSVRLTVSEAGQTGSLVVETDHIAKAWGERPIVRDFSTRIMRGDRIGIVGANGAGKTTLVGLLTGVLAPDAGTIRFGSNLTLARLDQKRDDLDPLRSLRETLTDGRGDMLEVGGVRKHVVSYMKDFLFSPEQAGTPVGVLSGGERGRLSLARLLARPSNVLVLDEPTNDLDLETLDLLQDMLADYPGTVILVSHDRDFLDRTVTSIMMAEGDGLWQDYAGGYSDMLAQRGSGVESRAQTRAPKGKTPPIAPTPSRAAQPTARRKMSFRDKHRLDTLPAIMDRLREDIQRLQDVFDDQTLYARDPVRFSEVSSALERAQSELTAAEEEWLVLEMQREESEG